VAFRSVLPLLICSLTACKVGPNFVPPNEPVPQEYAAAKIESGIADAPRADGETAPDPLWWHQFHDAPLDQLEDQAAAENLGLKASYLRILAARIQVQAARAQGCRA
jgi:outer membrane protein TolC